MKKITINTAAQSSTAHSTLSDSATTGVLGKQTPITSPPINTGAATATLPRDATAHMVKLADIRIDGGTQTRAEITNDNVAEYMEAMQAGAKFPAVVLYDDGQTRWLADGFHRYTAAEALGRTEILAELRPGSRTDAIEHALKANTSHGLRQTNADKRRCARIAIEHFGDRSDHVLAEMCGVSHTFVAGQRAQLATVASSLSDDAAAEQPPAPKVETRVGRDGKTRKNPVRQVKLAQNDSDETNNPIEELLPKTSGKPTADALEEPLWSTVTVAEPEAGPDTDVKEQPTVAVPAGEKYKIADGSSANLPTQGFLTVADLTRGLGKLKIVAKVLDGGKVSSALVSRLERGFLTITAAVYEIADADADQADKDAVVEILRAVANTIKTDY